MGTTLAYELIKKITDFGHKEPIHFFASGRHPPHITKEKNLYNKPDNEIKKEIFRLGGTPEELLKDDSLLKIFLPILRADYRIIENYNYSPSESVFNCGISVLNGLEDDEVTESDMDAWKAYTTGECSNYYFKGHHFYINTEENQRKILGIINNVLCSDK